MRIVYKIINDGIGICVGNLENCAQSHVRSFKIMTEYF